MAGGLDIDSPPGEVPTSISSTLIIPSSIIHNPNSFHNPTAAKNVQIPAEIPTRISQFHTTTSPSLQIRQNSDCANSITAAVEQATVALSRSFQQNLATASQALAQASISASAALQAVSASASNVIIAVEGSSSSAVALASAQLANLSSVASAASASLLLVQEKASFIEASASSAVASALAALASATGLASQTIQTTSTSPSETSSAIPHASPERKLTAAQVALIVIGSMLASIFITLTVSFLLLRHKKRGKLRQEKEVMDPDVSSNERRTESRALPIAASMRKRDADQAAPLPPPQFQAPAPDVTAALSFSAFHQEDNPDLFAGEIQDRLMQLESSVSSQKPGRVYIPPSPSRPISASTGSVQQAKQVKFSSIRAVNDVPALLGRDSDRDEGEEGFTVSRTVTRSKSKKGEKGKGVEIGIRTWIEGGSGSE